MLDSPYQILGTTCIKPLSREAETNNLLRKIDKPGPEHVSVVGARYIGKSVLLKSLVKRLEESSRNIDACLYWDLSIGTPNTDAEFYENFACRLAEPLGKIDREYAKELTVSSNFSGLKTVFDFIALDKRNVVVFLDNMDNFLRDSTVTRNLWDNLRTFAEKHVVYFVTGSRRPLREGIGSIGANLSVFWSLFGVEKYVIRPFDRNQLIDFMASFNERGIRFSDGAITEIARFSGGMPILAAALSSHIWDETADGVNLDNADICSLASGFVDDKQSLIEEIWIDCFDPIERKIITEMARGTRYNSQRLKPHTLTRLKDRGFVSLDGNELKLCKSIEIYVKEYLGPGSVLAEIFCDPNEYLENMREVLNLRLAQVQPLDSRLNTPLKTALSQLPNGLDAARQIRILVDDALKLIWSIELPDNKIPEDWSNAWKYGSTRTPPQGAIPTARGEQCVLLDLMTHPDRDGSTRVSRATFLMLNYLRGVGNFGHHDHGLPLPLPFMISACSTAIEMCAQLQKDIV